MRNFRRTGRTGTDEEAGSARPEDSGKETDRRAGLSEWSHLLPRQKPILFTSAGRDAMSLMRTPGLASPVEYFSREPHLGKTTARSEKKTGGSKGNGECDVHRQSDSSLQMSALDTKIGACGNGEWSIARRTVQLMTYQHKRVYDAACSNLGLFGCFFVYKESGIYWNKQALFQ